MTEAGKPIAEVLKQFVDGFNTNALEEVMAFFADDAVYEPGDGRTHRGRDAIREAFRPQFSNAFGTMRFIVNDQVIDEGARKASIRWVCQHDFATMTSFAQRLLFKALYGRRAGWYGTDTFHFDERGKIVGKYSYANYGSRPHVRRDLG
jgi:ketosteroid isomerase-like protein